MTDNEIIKAMEQVIKKGDAPIGEHWQLWITTKLAKDILDCINRQKAEIERLEKKANTPFAKITFDRDKLQEIVDEYVKNIEIDINLAKSEAIKEFVEKFEDRIEKELESTYKAWFIVSETIVEESKLHISSENAIKKIRDCLNRYEPISYYKVVKTIDNLLEEMAGK